MRQLYFRVCFILIAPLTSALNVNAQENNNAIISVDPELLILQNSKVPKEYTVAAITVKGIHHLDTSIILSNIGVYPGDKVMIPGSDLFSKAIQYLWRQKFFSDIRVSFTKVHNDRVWVEFEVTERPRLGKFKFIGATKTETEELQAKMQLSRQSIITENMFRRIREVGTKYYREKGFEAIQITIHQDDDLSMANSKIITIHIDKGHKTLIDEIRISGNDHVDAYRIKKQLKGTKERSRLSFFPSPRKATFDTTNKMSFKAYLKDWGFLSIGKTKRLLDPYVRIKLFSSAKFNESKYDEDKERMIRYYNSMGFRDASIERSRVAIDSSRNKIYIDIAVNEGRRYYFGDIH